MNIDMTDDLDEWKYTDRLIIDEQGLPLTVPFRDTLMGAYLDTGSGIVKATFWTRLLLVA